MHNGKLSGNGIFTQRCQQFFEQRYGIRKALLTTSGTTALELAALLLNLQPGDDVIVPSYTFTSTANAFVLRGARVVFADSQSEHPNLDADHVARLITPHTRAIVPVHYAGDAAPMTRLLELANQHNLWLIEDAAQAIDGEWQHRPLGTLGHLAAFSFHETKNISAGEGGLLAINDARLMERAEIMWEKGTNRAAFFRGEAARYEWVDVVFVVSTVGVECSLSMGAVRAAEICTAAPQATLGAVPCGPTASRAGWQYNLTSYSY